MHPTLKSEWIHRAIYAKLVYEFVVVILLHRCDRETVDYDFSLSAAVVPFSVCVLHVIYRVPICSTTHVYTYSHDEKFIGKFLITYLNDT